MFPCGEASKCLGQSVNTALDSNLETSLKNYLQRYVREVNRSTRDDGELRYFRAFVDLNNDGEKEAIVYLSGRDWCGTGGCNTHVLSLKNGVWTEVTKITTSRPPITVEDSLTNGWRVLSVLVSGGGISPGYTAELQFDGKSYPSNPTTPPAYKRMGNVSEKVIMSSADIEHELPLFP